MDPAVKKINDTYFNVCMFEALMRGIHLAVFISALFTINTATGRAGQSRKTMTTLVVIFFLLSTADLGSFWAYVRRAFITRGETAESIAAALNEYPAWFLGAISFADTNAVLADLVIIWRAWVVWDKSWKIVVIPFTCTLLTIAFCIIAIFQSISTTVFGIRGVDYATALYSTSLVTTIFCTTAIVYRIIQVGGLRSYRNIVEILIESAMLYSVATLFALVAFIVDATASEFATGFWTSCTGIAPTLVIARVAAGQAKVVDETTWPWDQNNAAEDQQKQSTSLPQFQRPMHRSKNSKVFSMLGVQSIHGASETKVAAYDRDPEAAIDSVTHHNGNGVSVEFRRGD